jgi:hypothetical protein
MLVIIQELLLVIAQVMGIQCLRTVVLVLNMLRYGCLSDICSLLYKGLDDDTAEKRVE